MKTFSDLYEAVTQNSQFAEYLTKTVKQIFDNYIQYLKTNKKWAGDEGIKLGVKTVLLTWLKLKDAYNFDKYKSSGFFNGLTDLPSQLDMSLLDDKKLTKFIDNMLSPNKPAPVKNEYLSNIRQILDIIHGNLEKVSKQKNIPLTKPQLEIYMPDIINTWINILTIPNFTLRNLYTELHLLDGLESFADFGKKELINKYDFSRYINTYISKKYKE